MRNLIKLLLVVVLLTAFSGALSAQDNKQRMTREQLAEVQAKHIAGEMALDDATAEKFVEAYCQFQKEIWGIGGKPKMRRQSMTEEDAKNVLTSRFEHSQKILDIRKKYYDIYGKFLTQKQILRVYEMEDKVKNDMRDRFHKNQDKGKNKAQKK